MTTPIPPTQTTTIRERTLSLLAVAVDLGLQFLHLSNFGGATKVLVDQMAQRVVELLKQKVSAMPEEEILGQVYYIRDEVIPFLLGTQEATHEPSSRPDKR